MVRVVAVTAAVVLGLAACGDSDDDGGDSGGSDGSGAPVKIVGLWEIEGESTVAKSSLENGAQMAIEEINDAGGVNGQPIEYERVSTPISPPELTAEAVRLGLESNPSALIGVASGPAALVAAPLVDSAEVPLLTNGQSDAVLLTGDSGSDWVFSMRPTERSAQETAVRYAVETLGAEDLGLLYVNTEYGANAVPVQRDMSEELGATVVAERDYAPDANDLTEQVLAMRDADAVVNWAFPNPLGVQLNQFVQNGIDIPTIDAAAAGITVNSDLARGEAIEQLYGVTDCNPAGDERAEVRDWAAEYESRFDEVADFASAGSYDAVHLVAAAAEQAGAADPASVREGLLEIEFTDGVCAPIYQADAANTLHHQATVVGYAGGEPRTEEVFEIDMAE